jgi:hypothetical protein
MSTTTTKELHTGINGEGGRCYLVVTVDDNGRWLHIENFDNEAEAINWIKWA